MVCSRKHRMQRVCFNTLLLDECMSEETGPRREACGIDSCQLKVSSFCSGALLLRRTSLRRASTILVIHTFASSHCAKLYFERRCTMSLGILCFTTPRCAWAISAHQQQCVDNTHLLHNRPMSRYTHEYGRTSSWCNKERAPPSKHNTRNSHSG